MVKTVLRLDNELRTKQSSTFIDNLSIPIHRWFRYSAGFSAVWVKDIIEREKNNGRKNIVDPFAGTGTVLIESERCGVNSIGVESHPLISRVAQAKLCWREDPKQFYNFGLSVLELAKKDKSTISKYPELIQRCFSEDSLKQLDSLKKSFLKLSDNSPKSGLTWLGLISILRECSGVGTAPWQYVLPNKKKKNPLMPFESFKSKIILMAKDMENSSKEMLGSKAKLLNEDIRNKGSIQKDWGDLLITSPPYANNFDYADTTRLEMTFLGEIDTWGDLQEKVRPYLIRSCTQHVSPLVKETQSILKDKMLKPISTEISEVCEKLDLERENHAGKKQYHTMIAYYFYDMAKVWKELRRIMNPNSLLCFVVGDSAPYGVYTPVEKWLGELAVASGFQSYNFEKTRDRNVKWKNRKHTVPLHEGRLWVRG